MFVIMMISFVRYEVFMAVKIQVKVLWVVMPCNVAVRSDVTLKAVGPPKHCHPTATLHSITPQRPLLE